MKLFSQFVKRVRKRTVLYDGISICNGRPTNMDSLGVLERKIDGQRALLAIVCDGVGSLENGGYAAAEATKRMIGWFSELEDLDRIHMRLREKLLEVNGAILDEAQEMDAETATTFSALLLTDQKYYIAHVGDSRIYQLHGQQLSQITRDDVSDSGALTSCIGHDQNPLIYCGQGTLEADTFLLCSDGMYKRMDDDYLASQLASTGTQKEIRTAMGNLVQYAAQKGEQDNITVVIVKISNGG